MCNALKVFLIKIATGMNLKLNNCQLLSESFAHKVIQRYLDAFLRLQNFSIHKRSGILNNYSPLCFMKMNRITDLILKLIR